jgi:hypothetical protein
VLGAFYTGDLVSAETGGRRSSEIRETDNQTDKGDV